MSSRASPVKTRDDGSGQTPPAKASRPETFTQKWLLPSRLRSEELNPASVVAELTVIDPKKGIPSEIAARMDPLKLAVSKRGVSVHVNIIVLLVTSLWILTTLG